MSVFQRLVGMGCIVAAMTIANSVCAQDDDAVTRDLLPTQRSWLTAVSEFFNPKDDAIHVRLLSDRPKYQIGDTMTLTVEPDKDAYIYVYDLGTSGTTYLLYPNKFQRNNHVKANTKLKIPAAKSKWSIKVQGPSGPELIFVMASSKKMSAKESKDIRYQLKTSPFATVMKKPKELARDLVIGPGELQRGSNKLVVHVTKPAG